MKRSTLYAEHQRVVVLFSQHGVQEIDHYGRPDARLRPVGTGAGYMWSICSMTRVAEMQGGSIIEIETIALTRDVPSPIAWLVNPIISKVLRNALCTTLRNTKAAIPRYSYATIADPSGE
jgi:hypothetical protein